MCVSFLVGDSINIKYMEEALKEAKKAYKKGDVPVGAVVIYKNKIIAKAHNLKEKNNNAIAHAELIAINKACKKLKTWHLEKCELYTTLEPCLMCTGAIEQSRIKKIYYAAKNNNFGKLEMCNNQNNNITIIGGILEKESSALLINFFKERRK